MSDIFQEVDEALQQEKLEKIWQEYRTTIIAAIIILIGSTALTTTYYGWDAKRDMTETSRLMQALETENPIQSVQAVITDTRKTHGALGLMAAAGLLVKNGKGVEAAALYKQAIDSRKTPRDLRDLARILYVQNASETSQDDLMNVLKPLLVNEKSPWIWHARIEAAVISAHQNDDYAEAITYLAAFETATTIPQSLKQRAQALKHVYQLKSGTHE